MPKGISKASRPPPPWSPPPPRLVPVGGFHELQPRFRLAGGTSRQRLIALGRSPAQGRRRVMPAYRLAQQRQRADQTRGSRPHLRKHRQHHLDLRRPRRLARSQLQPALDLEARRRQLVERAGAPPVLTPLEQRLLTRGVDVVDRPARPVDQNVHRGKAQLGAALQRGLLEPRHRHLGLGPQHLPLRAKLRRVLDRDARRHAHPVLGVDVLVSHTELDLIDRRLALLAGLGRLHLGHAGLDGGIVGQPPPGRVDARPVVGPPAGAGRERDGCRPADSPPGPLPDARRPSRVANLTGTVRGRSSAAERHGPTSPRAGTRR